MEDPIKLMELMEPIKKPDPKDEESTSYFTHSLSTFQEWFKRFVGGC